MLGISSQSVSTIEHFIEDQGITFPILRDSGGRVYSDFALLGGQSPYPRDFIIDPQGVIRFADTEYDPGTMITVIESLIGSKTASTSDKPEEVPKEIAVLNAYPNPFNSSLTIEVVNGIDQSVEIDIYDITGRKADSIYSGWLNSGRHRFQWLAMDQSYQTIGSGIYVVILRGDRATVSKRVVLLQ